MMNVKEYIEKNSDMYGKYNGSRKLEVRWKRFYLFYYLKTHRLMSYQAIADLFDLDSHATVINGVKRYTDCWMYRDINYFTKPVRDTFNSDADIRTLDLEYPEIPEGPDWVGSDYVMDLFGTDSASHARKVAVQLGIDRIDKITGEPVQDNKGKAVLYNRKQLHERQGYVKISE